MGYGDCAYMVRVAFVPTDAYGELDYAITLDPHVFVSDAANSVIPEGCDGEFVYAYACAFCGASKTVVEYGHAYEWRYFYSVDFDENGYLTVQQKEINTCTRCGEETCYTSNRRYYPNGQIAEESGSDYKYTYEYDYEARIRTQRYERFSDHYVRVTKYEMDTGNRIYRLEQHADGSSREYEYIWLDGQSYCTKNKHVSADGTWDCSSYEYDFENDVVVETYEDSNGAYKVIKRCISTGEEIAE